MKVIKKNGVVVPYDEQKIIDACNKSAHRALQKLTEEDYSAICNKVADIIAEEDYYVEEYNEELVPVEDMHIIVENALSELYPKVGESYKQYRDYKTAFVKMLDEVYKKSQEIRYIGDVSNANTDSAMISSQRSLIYGQLNKELYQKFFLNKEELQAAEDGYIYINDMKDRLDGVNCCLFDIAGVLKGGFEMGNIWYNEPKTVDTAFDVIGDIVLSAASQQYGGFTIPQVDDILAPYAEKSYQKYFKKYHNMATSTQRKTLRAVGINMADLDQIQLNAIYELAAEDARVYAEADVKRDIEQGFQGWEYKFNTVGSSRGDYPFIAMSLGINTSKWGLIVSEIALEVRRGGQGRDGFKKPVLFPKVTFLYDEDLHGEGKAYEYLFDKAILCSSKTMYPDYLSLTGEGYIASIYKKYGKVISLMGCRASLSPWFERGGMHPADEKDTPIFIGRCNLGVVSLHLPMILAKARQENKDFYEVLNYYLEMIRNLHKRTYDFIGEKKASTNPMAWMQGGFLGGHLKADEKIKSLLPAMTMSFGITALNELNELYNGKSILEDGQFPLEVMKYINDYIDRIKEEDHILYAVYGTPAESLCGTQVEQFRKKYGVVEKVSDRPYVSNSFHCHVTEDISPVQKQDAERRFWDYFNGGKIQYCRYHLGYNIQAIKSIVRRAMQIGFYEGVNLSLAYCEDCGHEELEMDVCPICGSSMITKIDRMNGYLQYSRVHGNTRSNAAKMAEIAERKSM